MEGVVGRQRGWELGAAVVWGMGVLGPHSKVGAGLWGRGMGWQAGKGVGALWVGVGRWGKGQGACGVRAGGKRGPCKGRCLPA